MREDWFEFQMGIDTWTVSFVRALEHDGTELEGEMCFGLKEIHLNDKLKSRPNQLWSTLLHEILHAAEHNLGYDWGEDIVRQLEFALAPALLGIIALPKVPEAAACTSAPQSEAFYEVPDTIKLGTDD